MYNIKKYERVIDKEIKKLYFVLYLIAFNYYHSEK